MIQTQPGDFARDVMSATTQRHYRKEASIDTDGQKLDRDTRSRVVRLAWILLTAACCTIGAAIACGLWSRLSDVRGNDVPSPLSSERVAGIGTGVTEYERTERLDRFHTRFVSRIECGLPQRSFSYFRTFVDEVGSSPAGYGEYTDAILVSANNQIWFRMQRPAIPLRVMPWRFASNIVVFVFLIYALLFLLLCLRSTLRVSQKRCIHCAYPILFVACPECSGRNAWAFPVCDGIADHKSRCANALRLARQIAAISLKKVV